MIDVVENVSGLLNLFFSAVLTVLEIFFGPVLVVFGPLLQVFNAA